MVLGVFFVQLAFIASFVGAFHHPKPHDIRLGVIAPTSESAAQVVNGLKQLPGHPLDPVVITTRNEAVEELRGADVRAALVVAPTGTTDELLTASGAGSSIATAVQNILTAVEKQQGRALTITDVVPLQPGDARGLTGFYLTIGWLVGGYLVAS